MIPNSSLFFWVPEKFSKRNLVSHSKYTLVPFGSYPVINYGTRSSLLLHLDNIHCFLCKNSTQDKRGIGQVLDRGEALTNSFLTLPYLVHMFARFRKKKKRPRPIPTTRYRVRALDCLISNSPAIYHFV